MAVDGDFASVVFFLCDENWVVTMVYKESE